MKEWIVRLVTGATELTVPEPASRFLLGSGLLGLGRIIRKKR